MGLGEGDLVPGEAGDAGQRLSVEQHEQARDPVLDGVAVVVEQGADQRPPVVVFDLGDQAAGMAACGGPGHEGAGVVAGPCSAGELVDSVAVGFAALAVGGILYGPFTITASPVGTVIGGPLVTAIGPSATLLASGLVTIGVAAAALIIRQARQRREPGARPPSPPSDG
ncbi:MAG TPA: hypothetical protein VMV07_13355 [Streptosporangiaceae bacterium]|nr:hypothetical protein [Streptosporangiaceae bacterium]